MSYTIIFSFKDKPSQKLPWKYDLDSAKNHADNYMRNHNADHAEIVEDSSGNVVFARSNPDANIDD